MLTRIALALAAFSAPALAQPPALQAGLVPVAIETSLGRIVVALDEARAPQTTANFLAYADAHNSMARASTGQCPMATRA